MNLTVEDYYAVKQLILQDNDFLGQLADSLATMCAVYGPKERVQLGQGVQLCNSLLNTMSGQITIGDNTFTANNVSIITGSHDVKKTGDERKDFPFSGNDIVIGSGVWLCQGVTVLGPCKIGDNAVVAAGSVVLPGTEIGAGELYAGIPAVLKKKVVD